jgi:hypothetical protein
MSINYESYKEQALEACRSVFINEYNRSIGIPLPEIDFVLPDSTNYKSGQYYINIGDTWQIKLNFGLLPVSYKEFQEEVRVLTRHEIEHYMCCPYDVITYLRMLNAIISTYKQNYSYHKINIDSLAGILANQIADIIIDTKNYRIHKDETLKSEISWIKKGGVENFSTLPRHSKLMFLTKEELWKESLELNETDEDLIKEVKSLASEFEEKGITDKSLFIPKGIEYTHSFFRLFEHDKQDEQQKKSGDSGSSANAQHNQDDNPQFTPSKNSQAAGNEFIFQSPDKIKEALEQFAQETTLEQFAQVLAATDVPTLSDKEIKKIWFDAQNADEIPISEQTPVGSNANYSYPASWRLGDPIEEMDMMLSFATSPVIIPGITTKKWIQNPVFNYGSENKETDLLLVIDTSGSMGSIINPLNNIHQAVLASFGIIKYFENRSLQVALIGFSNKITTEVEWTKDYDLLRNNLLIDGHGGTNFPIEKIQSVIEKSKNAIVTVVISDGEINNLQLTLNYFIEYLNAGNKLFLFLQDRKSELNKYKILSDHGSKVVKAISAQEMREIVINDLL